MLFHEKRIPTDAISVLVTEARAGRFTSSAAVDAALECAGCANAYREDTPPVFGVASREDVSVPETDDELVDAADRLHRHVFGDGMTAGAISDAGDDAEAIGPLLPILLPIVLAILRRAFPNLPISPAPAG